MASPGQESESLNVQFLVDSMLAMVHPARPDDLHFNQRWLEYLGVTLVEVSGWKYRAFAHREDVEGAVARWRACVKTGENFEVRNWRPRGGWGILLDALPQTVTPRQARQQLPRQEFSR
jgi:PAS domain-containing protein